MICEKCDGVFSDRTAWDTETCPRCGNHTGKPKDFLYVNVYKVYREYGGPEEGGWWWNMYIPFHSHCLTDGEDPFKIAEELSQRFADLNEGNIYSMKGGVEIQAHVESHYGEIKPKERPYYE